jgi:hypothetical protein
MKLSAEEKARRKEEIAELKAKQARELHNCDNASLADREKNSKVFAITDHQHHPPQNIMKRY